MVAWNAVLDIGEIKINIEAYKKVFAIYFSYFIWLIDFIAFVDFGRVIIVLFDAPTYVSFTEFSFTHGSVKTLHWILPELNFLFVLVQVDSITTTLGWIRFCHDPIKDWPYGIGDSPKPVTKCVHLLVMTIECITRRLYLLFSDRHDCQVSSGYCGGQWRCKCDHRLWVYHYKWHKTRAEYNCSGKRWRQIMGSECSGRRCWKMR